MDEVIERLETEQTDAAWLPPYYYARALAANPKSSIRPLAIYKTGKSIASPTCLYVRKDSGRKTLQDLIGTRVYFPDESSWAVLNRIFAEDVSASGGR